MRATTTGTQQHIDQLELVLIGTSAKCARFAKVWMLVLCKHLVSASVCSTKD
jgi:hypothetical protein